MSVCILKTSSSSLSYFCAQMGASLPTSISCTLIRSLAPAFLTLPSRIVPTLSSRPISPTLLFTCLYFMTDVLAITLSPGIEESVLMISSVRPSAKYSSCWSELRIVNGSAATLLGSRVSILVIFGPFRRRQNFVNLRRRLHILQLVLSKSHCTEFFAVVYVIKDLLSYADSSGFCKRLDS